MLQSCSFIETHQSLCHFLPVRHLEVDIFFFTNCQNSAVSILAHVVSPIILCGINDLELVGTFTHTSYLLMHDHFVFASHCLYLSKTSGMCVRCLTQTNPSGGSSRYVNLTKVHAICELRLPFSISYARNIAVKYRECCQITPFFLLQEADSSQFIVGSEVHLTSARNRSSTSQSLLFFFFCFAGYVRPCRHKRGKAETRFELPSQITKGR